MNPVEVRHLQVLVALAEEGTFTDAAIRLHMSQPAVSRALARFEASLGVSLVERTTRSLTLTDVGQACYRAAVTALLALDAIADAANGRVRPLRLGYSWAAFGRPTSAILRTWREERPEVPLEVHRVDSRDAGLAKGLVDLAIWRGRVNITAPLVVEQIFDEGRVAAVPANSPLATRDRLELADLRNECIALTPSIGTTTLELWPPEIRPQRSIEVANTDEWLVAIASGEAVGVTPESTPTQHPHPGVAFVPMPATPRIPVSLVWPADRMHPSIPDFLATIRRVAV